MKRISQILYSLGLITLLILSSCGKNEMSQPKAPNQSALNNNGGACSCDTTYLPVCGVNNITYDNACIASCYKVTKISQGNCICTERPVCADDGKTYTECYAQTLLRYGTIKKIVSYGSCGTPTL